MTNAEPSLLEPGGFFGTYRVVRPLGHGGTGTVYLVDGPEEGTRYALKILDPEIAKRNSEFVRRFVREAEFTMDARHENLVEVYDAGEDEESGLCYLTMEYMEGGSLRDLLKTDGALSIAGALAIARDLAKAIRFGEENGLVHRDVKPDNVMFTKEGRAKLTDLGITRFADSDEDESSRTLAGRIVGTPGYIAPEQLINAHGVDIRADIYSLGVIFYEMLAGERPNAAKTAMGSLAKTLQGTQFPDVRERRPDVPAPLAELISAMTDPDPDNRPASAAYLVELLEDPEILKDDEPAPAAGPEPEPAPREASVLPAMIAVSLALAALAAALITLIARRTFG